MRPLILLLLVAGCATPNAAQKPGQKPAEGKPALTKEGATTAAGVGMEQVLAVQQLAVAEVKAKCAVDKPISVEEEAQLGRAVALQRVEQSRLLVHPYVAIIGRDLADFSSRPTIGWTFGVLEAPLAATYSSPGGYVFVTTGLLRALDNEAQLAALLAYEIGHVSARHSLKQHQSVVHNICVTSVMASTYMKQGLADQLPMEVRRHAALDATATGASISAMSEMMMRMELLGAGRAQQEEADQIAIQLMLFAGYDTAEYVPALKKLSTVPASDRLSAADGFRARWAKFGAGVRPPLKKAK